MSRHPTNETGYLSLQINLICLLLALVGVSVIMQHPNWFGGVPTKGEISAPYSR
jgi:hypothetical protein